MTDVIDGIEPSDDELLSATTDGQDDNQADQTAELTGGEEGEPQETAPKPKKTAQDRIAALTREKHEARREADYWRDAALKGHEAPQPKAAPVQPRDAAPSPDDFQYGDADPNYLVALAKHEAKIEVRQEFQAREQAQRLTESRSTFEQRVAEQFPDGEPEGIAALRSLPAIRSEITDVILSSDKGPLLADHLGDHPSVLTRLNGLAPHLVGFELAKIEAALAAPPSPKRVTNAPDPAPKPRGSGGQFSAAPDTNDFAAFERFADKVHASR